MKNKIAHNYPLPAKLYRIHNKLNPNPYEPTKRNSRSIQRKRMDAGNILPHPNCQCTTNKIGCETNPTEKMQQFQ
jgi:hypothetical protein